MVVTTPTTTTSTVGEGDALVTWDLHDGPAGRTPLVLLGSPMDASGFTALVPLLDDRPVVTLDPRGAGRNPRATSSLTPELHAEDVHRVVTAADLGPVDLFATSGGAVVACALLAEHPGDVRRVVLHEPPTGAFLPDRAVLEALSADLRATYDEQGRGPAMAKFIEMVVHSGELTPDWLDRPAPDPARYGQPVDDDGDRTDPLMRNSPAVQDFVPDLEALRALGDRLVVACGADSGETWAARGARSIAAQTGVEVVELPGGHAGFAPPGHGGPGGDPAGFAARLRALLP